MDAGSSSTDYRRELDLSTAVNRVTYQQDGSRFVRETFCSYPDQVIVSRMTANAKGKYSGSIKLVGGRSEKTSAKNNRLVFSGKLENGMDYEAQVVVAIEGGTVLTMTGAPIDNGTVVITDGKITAAGEGAVDLKQV